MLKILALVKARFPNPEKAVFLGTSAGASALTTTCVTLSRLFPTRENMSSTMLGLRSDPPI